jgi:hypothetical protein
VLKAAKNKLHKAILGPDQSADEIHTQRERRQIASRSIMVAQVAIDNKIPLLHDDKDFDAIVSISSLRIY